MITRYLLMRSCECAHADHRTAPASSGAVYPLPEPESAFHALGAKRDPLHHRPTALGMRAICTACRDAGHLGA